MRNVLLWAISIYIIGLLVATSACKHDRVRKFPASAEMLLEGFRTGASPDAAAYDRLFDYFVQGFEIYRTPRGAGAVYPGLPSRNGRASDTLEGFSRMAPLIAAWLHSGRPETLIVADGRSVDLAARLRQGLLTGTDPNSPEYWGRIEDLNQRIVEASDIALAIWLARDRVWQRLTPKQQGDVAVWLRQVEHKRVSDNNWHLFPVFVHAVLESIGSTGDAVDAHRNYQRFKSFYRGHGWFTDGPGDIFDYYNAWSIHYQLYWLEQVNPSWDAAFIDQSRREFLSSYRYLFGPHGFPVMGRSVCYRMAAPVALVFGSESDPAIVRPAEARRALDVIWSYYIQNGAVRSGAPTQGLCGSDPRILDNYSGPASCLWALRSLVAAFYLSPTSQFWSVNPSPLPVEQRSYRINIFPVKWTVVGVREDGAVRIEKVGDQSDHNLDRYGTLRRALSLFLGRPFRPDNHHAKYGLASYDSRRPFCGCSP